MIVWVEEIREFRVIGLNQRIAGYIKDLLAADLLQMQRGL
jgi:hypothetical protein